MQNMIRDSTQAVPQMRGAGTSLPERNGKDIHLIDTHIAGTGYISGFADIEKELTEGTRLIFVREWNNNYDGWAIRVESPTNVKTGYLPRNVNEIIARLMDAGEIVYGKILGRRYEGNWEKILISVYLKRSTFPSP